MQPPRADDTRRPAFFTGHIAIDNDIFRYMPVRYAAITILREPVSRLVSHYRARSMLTGSLYADDISAGRLSVSEFLNLERASYPLQFERFGASPDVALRALTERISIFGLQERYDDFLTMLGSLLGLPDLAYRKLNQTPSDAPMPREDRDEELRQQLESDIEFYSEGMEIFLDRARRAPSFASNHPWRPYYAP